MPWFLTDQVQNHQQALWQMAQQQQQAFQQMVQGSLSIYMKLLFSASHFTSQEGSRVARVGLEGVKQPPQTTDQGLPLADYDQLSAYEVCRKIEGLSVDELTELRAYEKHHENRAILVESYSHKMREINGERITRLLLTRLEAK